LSLRALPYIPAHRWELKTSELSTLQKKEARALLYGPFREKTCFFCKEPLGDEVVDKNPCDIHHILPMGELGCNYLIYIHLAHHAPCNASAGKAKGIQMREKTTWPSSDPTFSLREKVSYMAGSPEMKVNAVAETKFRSWLAEKIREKGWILKSEAICGGAEACGVNPQTTRRYLDKLLSDEGPYEEILELMEDTRRLLGHRLVRKSVIHPKGKVST